MGDNPVINNRNSNTVEDLLKKNKDRQTKKSFRTLLINRI